MRLICLLFLLWSSGCHNQVTPIIEEGLVGSELDMDGDGWTEDEDCDDADAQVNPGADERCDGKDNDCDGEEDEDDAVDAATWYPDEDEDGFGDSAAVDQAVTACDGPDGWVADDGDCDDNNAFLTELREFYLDADADGFGDPAVSVESCRQPSGYLLDDTDCDDDDPRAFPGAIWYLDGDGDGYGQTDLLVESCLPPGGYAFELGDCDDTNAAINPGAEELCDDIDNNCDGTVDEDGAADGTSIYLDGDSDGYGDATSLVLACEAQRTGYVQNGDDCDDTDAAINPAAVERCYDGIDWNCDGDTSDDCPLEHCGDITSDETWSNAQAHFVSCTINVQHGTNEPVLTIEGGATVYFADGTGLVIGDTATGGLAINGTGSRPVLFTSGVNFPDPTQSPDVGDWSGIVFGPSTDESTSVVSNLELELAGHGGNAAIQVDANDILLQDCTLTDNDALGVEILNGAKPRITGNTLMANVDGGIYADDSSGFSDFSNNTIQDNGGYAVEIIASEAGWLDSGSSYCLTDGTGNCSTTIETFVVLRGDTIDQDLTLAELDVPYYVTNHSVAGLTVKGTSNPTLSIEDGVEIRFESTAALVIGGTSSGGSLEVDGVSGVVFTSYDPTKCWQGITMGQAALAMDVNALTVSRGGGNGFGNLYLVQGVDPTIADSSFTESCVHGLYVGPDSFPEIVGSSFNDNASDGIYIDTDGGLASGGSSPTFELNDMLRNGDYPISLPPSALGEMADGTSNQMADNGESHVRVWIDTVTSSATWRPQNVGYLFQSISSSGTTVGIWGSTSPVVTIEAGTTFYMPSGTEIVVGSTYAGALATDGTATNPVSFLPEGACSGGGDWDGITFESKTIGASTELYGIVVDCAGGNGDAAIYARNGASMSLFDCTISNSDADGVHLTGTGEMELEDCNIIDNADYGVYVDTYASLASFTGNTITGNDTAVKINVEDVAAISGDSILSGNSNDYIEVSGGSLESPSVTWVDSGAPLYVTSDITLKGSNLTIEGGVELRFAGNKKFQVGYNAANHGSLTADGTDGVITFTSADASPAAGDWHGISGNTYNDGIYLYNVVLEYGGGGTGSANLYLNYTSATVIDSTIRYSSGYGITCVHSIVTHSGVTFTDNALGDTYGC